MRIGRPVRTVLVALVVVVVVMLGLLWSAQRRLIYFPDRAAVPPADRVVPGARDVVLETADGLRLGAWLLPPRGPDSGVAVLVAPGNAGNRLARVALGQALCAAGFTVLLMDYRGYGGNPGSPTQANLARDARAALAYLTGPMAVAPGRIVYFGESLGTGVVTELSRHHPPGGLVLRSPFLDLAAVGAHHYPLLPVRAMLRDRFPVADLIGEIRVPTVVVYGTADSIVPPAQSRTVADRAGGLLAVRAVPGADHNDAILTHGPPVVEAVAAVAAVAAAS